MMQDINVDMEKMIALRQYLHAHPELSREEYETSKYMQSYLQREAAPDEILPLAGPGFAAIYNGETAGKTVLIRAELDALPIQEINDDLPYKSVHDGVGHKCGHDGHMTILAGIAHLYSRKRPSSGRVVLLFQPDEETGTGARECQTHPNFKKIEPDYTFALHNFPGFPDNQIICTEGTFTSAVKFFAVKLQGKEAHSAMPETGVSPALAIAEITQISQDIQKQYDKPDEYALIVPIHINMGVSSSGVAPGYGEAHFTIRTCRNEVVDEIWNSFQNAIQKVSSKYNLTVEYEILEHFSASQNEASAAQMVKDATTQCDFDYRHLESPFKAGEDFGEIVSRYKGAMFGLGAGEDQPQLHNPDYDFPDEIIPTGIKMFSTLVSMALEDAHHSSEKQEA